MMREIISLAVARRLLFLLAPIAFGVVAMRMGMDANWDLRNYHYYNAWAFLTDRHDRDIAVAQIPSFYNPFLDIPYFLLAERLSARGLSFILGLAHGLNFILLTLLAERLLRLAPWPRLGLAAFLAAAGSAGAVALSEVGTVFYDNVLSLGFFASLLIAIARWEKLTNGTLSTALLVGLPAGLAFGLKQTSVIFPIGLCIALLVCLPAAAKRRVQVAFYCGIGVLGATIAGGGYWMWHLWENFGNPLFPMFNQYFRSPWGLPESYRDVQNLWGSLGRRLFFPFVFSFDTRAASEIVFQDFRILVAFLLVPPALLAWHARRRSTAETNGLIDRNQAAFILLSTAAAYVVWLQMFSFYRYITAIEMLSPLLVVIAIDLLPGRLRLSLAIALVALLVVTTRPGTWIRVPFSDKAVEVARPPIADPAHTILLLAGHEPLSFLLPAFPPEMRFLRIDSTFTNPDQTEVRFNPVMRRIIAEHTGPLQALYIPTERHDVVRRLAEYGLTLESEGCGWVTSPIGAAPYALCPVRKAR